MGYGGVWHTSGMGYEGVDCIHIFMLHIYIFTGTTAREGRKGEERS